MAETNSPCGRGARKGLAQIDDGRRIGTPQRSSLVLHTRAHHDYLDGESPAAPSPIAGGGDLSREGSYEEICQPRPQRRFADTERQDAATRPDLAQTFPAATSIVVQDRLQGFRRHPDLHILLVEVIGPDKPGPYLVKIGTVEKLQPEIDGWRSCRPEGLHHDLVFLPLSERYREPGRSDQRLMSLVYGDAQQFIGVAKTAPFEEAVLNSVRFGLPTPQSVSFVLVELFERIGHLLYGQSFVEEPDRSGYALFWPRIDAAIESWKTVSPIQAIRAEANVLVNHGVSKFFDPVDYLEIRPRAGALEEERPHRPSPAVQSAERWPAAT